MKDTTMVCPKWKQEVSKMNTELEDICTFIWYVYGQQPLNGDDIEEIMRALKEWNGDE